MVKKNQKNNINDILNEPLAIVGMNCQFPGVDSDVEDVDAFHEMLIKGQTPIKEVPKNRWDIEEYYDADRKKADKIITRKGGFLNNTHLFDADFFKISPAEAKQIDPQHRLFLEVAIRALNHANLTLDSLKESNASVYCGISTHDYSQLNCKENIEFNAYTPIGAANSAAAGRLCYFLDLKGPSMAVDTACASSLSALYLAGMALRAGQSHLAIVGGVHLSLCPEGFIGFTKANMLSAAGQCNSFDINADGFVLSEGCGVVIVKRLSDAIKDNNTIHAVIRSIVMNQAGDGTSLVAPNLKAQIAMHQAALEQANRVASDIDYIEAHGSGTAIGDSVEFEGIESIHRGHHSKDNPLVIGALKSNLGHTISASGIASLIKVIGALKHETIPPNLHYKTPNTSIDPDNIPAIFPVKATAFIKHNNKKRCAQVSNFGFSGVNVSAIVEEPQKPELSSVIAENGKPQCFVISAGSEYSLKQMMAKYVHYLKESLSSLHDICCTLINCRDHYKFRCALIVNDKEELIKKIESEDYELKKVVIQKDIKRRVNDADPIYESYLLGENTRLEINDTDYNKVDLPLYCFDRKPYWHKARRNTHGFQGLSAFYQQSKEQQIETIKTRVVAQIRVIFKKESIDEYHELESLGLTKSLMEAFEHSLLDLFSLPDNTRFPSHLTLDTLARYLQQIIVPATVHRQPIIHVLDVEPIAIIGMSCRLPKAANIDAFLSLLERGESGMTDIPIERWDNDKYYDANVDALGRLYIKQLGLIDNVSHFDAEFFNISPREAKLMSPQLRVFMETSYHALEDANLPLDAIKDSNTGVFVGCGTNEYPEVLASQGVSLEELNIYFATGNVLNAIPGRVAYSFDFHGPIQAVDTACSSSMTAIHNACLSLQSGDCNMALAGGVNILLAPESNITLSKAKMLSPESRCKTFSEDANGYARSEGCGVVVLKRLSTAINDKDTILAVIKGSAVNSDGKNGGFTVPNGAAQEEVIRSALAKSKLSSSDIDYIEAHGTGTPVADPIEFNALTRVFSENRSLDKPLYISSVKTNIGHCESASGVAGIIKAVLSLQTQTLFKHLNFKKLNPGIELKNTLIPLSNIHWQKESDLRNVGVSSFGFSGANAHVILQEALPIKKEARTLPQESLLVLSAKSKAALELLLASYQKYLSTTSANFADICYTAATCRSHFLFRVAIKASNAQEAAVVIENSEYTIYQIKKEKESLQPPISLAQLQLAYQDGFSVNWSDFYKSLETQFEKVKLPLYEFVREEHWFGDKGKLKDAQVPKDWCFQLQWQPQPCAENNRKMQSGHWLLIGDTPICAGFISHGLQIVLEGDDYSVEKLDGIIFAAALSPTSPTDIDSNIDFQKKIIKKLLGLVKELNHKAIELQLVVLTTNGIAELAVGQLNLSNSPLIGFCKTLALELPQFNTILIDVENIADLSYSAHVVYEINHNHGQGHEHMIAYRAGKRLAARLKKTMLVDKKRPLQGEGRYLITGGCGGLGLVTAQALLSAGAREVILTSRHVDKPALKVAIKKIQSFYPGRTIHTMSLDVTDKEKLRSVLLDLNADGLLKGIIHAAGAAIAAPLIEHQDEDVDYLFSAKVKGGWYLHELSQQCELDFFVVYSSIASVFGSNKESVYSATNSFLDALIAERQRLGLVGTSIQWGPWGEVGMANKRSRDQSLRQALINNEQGHALIKVLINGQLNHVTLISPEYLVFMLAFVAKPLPAFYQSLADSLTVIDLPTNKNQSPWLSSYLEMSDEKRLKVCKDMLKEICKELLELSETEDLDEDEGFLEFGFDSLMLTEMAAKLREKLEPSLQVTVNIGFDYPAINKLAKYIVSELDTKVINSQEAKSFSKLSDDDSIAIIGMSCSLPNAPDIASFELLLEEGGSGINDIPIERWDNSKYYDPNRDVPGKSYVNKLGLIEHIKQFDANFFGISPREAKLMEPQQRIFLECSYKVLENANYPAETLCGSLTGVFVGVGPNEYYAQLEKNGFSNEELSVYSITGNVLNLIPGRVAYTFDFRGPALSVDTACSSSLVAIHYACQSLKNREIDYALAGGVNVLLMPESNITLCKARALSPEGQCKTFDKNADGYVRSEGCGVILLKRLSDALRDKDSILAVIKGSAVNNDGKSAGLTVPNGKSQEEVMLKALCQSELRSDDISYIEAHGTGTPIGDPIEVHAINRVYGVQRSLDNPLYLGSVKTNIGHLESASGVASIIKTVISLQKNTIYKHLNFKTLNPNIEIQDTHIALQNIDWNSGSKPKCAGVNAFGFSGTNAHIILQEFPSVEEQRARKPAKTQLLVLSAKSQISLDKLANRYQQYLATSQHDFGDICFTAATRRTHYSYRLAVIAESAVAASRMLETGQFALSHVGSNAVESVGWALSKRQCKDASALLGQDPTYKEALSDYLRGGQVDWLLYYKNSGNEFIKVALPNYTFERREFWPNKKIDLMAQYHYPLISSESALQHLYLTSWSIVNQYAPINNNIPELLVISKDKERAKILLGNLNYQFVSDLSQIENIANKNILFIYEQDQFNSLVHCCQILFKSRPSSFILLTENSYAINENDVVNPYHTMASSFWKSFKNELDFDKNYTVDLDSKSSFISTLKHLFNSQSTDNQFAVRELIYVPRLTKKDMSSNQAKQKNLFDSEASYLVVGGTGGLAKPLIDYLIRRNVKHISLVSRSECGAQLRALIEDAAQQHVEIKHYQADASQYQPMKHIIETIERSANPLKGVFHLAGVIQDGLIVNLSDESIQTVLSAKMESAQILHQLTKNIPLKQFVLFSSTASLFGGRGQANYAAANGFLDGLANYRQQQGNPALAINWGPFHTVGMAANLTGDLQQHGFISLDQQCIDILDTLLASQAPQIAVCPMNWELYFKHAPKQAWLSHFTTFPRPVEPLFLNSLRQQTQDERVVTLSHVLCKITADVLDLDELEKITSTADLFTMGLDSLMSLEIRHRIHDQLQCESLSIPIEYFINDPSIDKIARHIADELQLIFVNRMEPHPLANAAVQEIALCDFQYLFWVINKFGHSFNIGMQLRLHGKLNKDYVFQAFDSVVKQQSAFWINFDKNAPTQILRKQGQFNLIYKDISLCSEADVLNDEFNINIMRIIPLAKQPLIRVYLYKINNELHELHMVFPHIIVDDASCNIVFSQFKKCYEALVLGEKLISIPEKDSFLNYAHKNNRHYEKNLDDKINFWKTYNNGFKSLYFGQEHHLPDAAVNQSKYLFDYPIEAQLIESFIDWHKEKNSNVSSGLVAACQLAFKKISGQNKIPVILIHSGREGSQYKSIVGLFAQYKRINICLNEEDQLIDCIKSIDEQLVKTAPYQQCALSIKNNGLKGSRLSIGHYVSYALNKLLLTKKFKRSKLNSTLIDYYLEFLSRIAANKKSILIKYKLNQFFNLNMPLQQPDRLSVVISITPGFFVKDHQDTSFANLGYTFSSHFACLDRPIGNNTLWIYFTKNQDGQYYLSVNGPLTTACKDQIAHEFNQEISKFLEDHRCRIINTRTSYTSSRACEGSPE